MSAPGWTGFFRRLLQWVFIASVAGALLALYGLFTQGDLLTRYQVPTGALVIKGVASAVQAVTSVLAASTLNKERALPAFRWVWLGAVVNISAYWAERLLLWQQGSLGGNLWFMLGLHGLWLGAIWLYIRGEAEENDGSGTRG